MSFSDNGMQLLPRGVRSLRVFLFEDASAKYSITAAELLGSCISRKMQEETLRQIDRKYWVDQMLGGAMTLNQCK